ncbi:MAG: sigma-70 family RNA polymerase sigma factor [Chloroflexi bacterium]|nr:sigma-70 family RNA polymerase sigma factor [Chloroflexota bacterium]
MSEAFLGEIRIFAGNYAPVDWHLCDGSLLSIAQNNALFSLIGVTYGGDGVADFALPDLRGRVPVHMGDQINKLLRVQHQLTQRLGREPSVEELAEALDVPPKKVENMIQVARRPLSLETPTDDEEDSVLGDFIEDDEAPPPDDTATYNLLREHLSEVLNGLPPREVRILQLRYGLLDGQAYTLEEVGRKMGVTRERVRQIEAQALSRLRHPSIRRKLRDYLGE